MCEQEPPTPAEDRALRQAAILAEYNSLRDEISARSRDQLVCVTASLIAIGALLSTVAANPAKFSSLLVIAPWILAVFGILWCDHAHAIHLIAGYLRDEVEQKKLRQLGACESATETVGWETYLQGRRQTSRLLGFVNILLPLVYFGLPSVAAIVAYFLLKFRGDASLPSVLEYSFVGIGVLLLLAMYLSWRRAYQATSWDRRAPFLFEPAHLADERSRPKWALRLQLTRKRVGRR